MGPSNLLRIAFDSIADGVARPNCLDDKTGDERDERHAFGGSTVSIEKSAQSTRGHLRFLSVFLASEFDQWITVLTPEEACKTDELWFYPIAIRVSEFAENSDVCPLDKIPDTTVTCLTSSNSMILLDHSSEGVLYNTSRSSRPWALAERVRSWCEQKGYDIRRIVILMPNNRIDQFKGQGIKPLHFCYSLAMLPKLYADKLDDADSFLQAERIETAFDEERTRRYHFLSFNRRPRAARFCFVFGILAAGLQDKGLISFPQITRHAMMQKISRSPNRLLPAKSPMKDLLSQFADHKNKLPLKIDLDFSAETALSSAIPRRLNVTAMDAAHYANSYFSVVTETNFDDGVESRFTEKIWKPAINFHPFILVGSPGCLEEFKDLGFRSFAPAIDETYDTLRDPNERMITLLNEVKRLCALKLDEMEALYKSLWPTLLHNRNHCFEAGLEAKQALVNKLLSYEARRRG